MIEGYSPLTQAFLATMFTWAVTALGSSMVFCFKGYKRSFLDASLGFAAGIMTAASFWSLLLPAIEISIQANLDSHKLFALFPVTIGFLLGAGFVYLTDRFLPDNYIELTIKEEAYTHTPSVDVRSAEENLVGNMRRRTANTEHGEEFDHQIKLSVNERRSNTSSKLRERAQFRRIVLLIIAVTVHNIPEGMAVGVGFGAIGKTKSATFQSARNLAIGIGLQNFPEGLAVSLPLYASGYSYMRSFWYGQLSGMVEPIAGVLGALAVGFAQAILPYALAFAAGAMLFVVFDNLMPEAASHGNSKLATWCCMIGFVLMMSLDVGLE